MLKKKGQVKIFFQCDKSIIGQIPYIQICISIYVYIRFMFQLTKITLDKSTETSAKPETGPTIPMEDTQKDKCIMAQVQDDDGTAQEQPPNMNIQGSVMVKEGLDTEMEERGTEKGMDEGELQKELRLEAELKREFCHSEPGLQVDYIHGSDLFGYVGIEAVLDQMRNKTMKVGFDFNIMVVGK